MRTMRHGMKNTHKLKARCYSAHLIDLNEYFSSFLGAKIGGNIGEMDITEIFFNGMPNV